MQNLLFLIIAVVMGITMSIYLPMNSSVSKYLGSVFAANITFFFVALITSVVLFLMFGEFNTIGRLKDVPVYLYATGIISAVIVLGTTFLIPHFGARKLFILIISGQIIMAIIVSHFGILESPKDQVTIKRLIGALMVIVGAYVSVS